MDKIFIDGQEGTTGLRILSRITDRSDLSVIAVDPSKRKDVDARLACMREADVTILCLPDEASREIVAAAKNTHERFRIIDASTAFRTSADWAYGLPELTPQKKTRLDGYTETSSVGDRLTPLKKAHLGAYAEVGPVGDQAQRYGDQTQRYGDQAQRYGDQTQRYGDQTQRYGDQTQRYGYPVIAAADRVSVPGCHATGFNLIAGTLIRTGVAGPDYPFCCLSVTGYSGGGKKMIDDYGIRDLPAPRQYGLTQQHKHLPEMLAVSGARTVIFNPVVSDYYSGMLITVPLHAGLLNRQVNLHGLYEVFAEYFGNRPLVKTIEPGRETSDGFLSADSMAGRDDLELLFYGSDDRLAISARFDNLGKGASGAAIQCMNLMLGLPETDGLVVG